jgi:3-oxoacyl-[acyl-carrier protein] reductase
MDLYLKGKTAVVTGASQGLGRGIARELSLEGVKVLAVARNEALLNSLKDEIISAGGVEPVLLQQDFTATDGPKIIADMALSVFDKLDILVNNAGKSRPMDVVGDEAEWEAAMNLDFIRHRQLTQHLLPHFINNRSGSILNITSTFELRSINASSVAKASITVWSKQLASQVGKYGIRVNCLQPGLIDTNNIRPYFPEAERKRFIDAEIPLGDFGTPQDIANAAAFLVSPRARYITGAVTVVDGGMKRYPF